MAVLRPTSSEAPPRTSSVRQGLGSEGDEGKLVNDLELATAQPEGMRTYGISELVIISNFRNWRIFKRKILQALKQDINERTGQI